MGATTQPVSAHQAAMGAYTAEGLSFGALDFRYWDPLAIPQLQTPILSLVGILASDDLMITTPLYHLLLEVS